MVTHERVSTLEGEVERLGRRLARLEGSATAAARDEIRAAAAVERPVRAEAPTRRVPAPPIKVAPPKPTPAPPAPDRAAPERKRTTPPTPLRRRRRTAADLLGGRSLEDLLGGSVLAWVGGLAVLIGVAFLFAVAVSNGWIGEAGRTLIAGSGATVLLFVGIWLHERKARTEAALATVATGVSALYVTLTVAAQVYELIPAPLALVAILGVGSLATALAVRWESKGIAALGIVGGLVSPVLAGAPYDLGTMAILAVAAGSAVGVLLRQRWTWLASAVFGVTVPQWVVFLFDGPAVSEALAVLVAFGAVGVVAAVGYEVRVAAERLRPYSAFLLALNAVVLAVAGWFAFAELGHETVGRAWLGALALAHVGLGITATRSRLAAHDFGLLAITIGVVVADVAFALSVDGPARTIGFAGAGVMFAALVGRRGGSASDASLSALGLGTQVALALLQVLVSDAPPTLIEQGGLPGAGAVTGLVAVVASCFASARLADAGRPGLRMALDALGLAVLAYLTALTLDGWALTAAWSAQAAVLARIARPGADPIALAGAYLHLLMAGLQALMFVALPEAVMSGDVEALPALAAFGSVAGAAFACARLVPECDDQGAIRGALDVAALAALAYLAAAVLDGAMLAAALSVGAVALAAVALRWSEPVAVWGGWAYLVLAGIQAVANVAPPETVVGGPADPLVASAALAVVSLAAFGCARLSDRDRSPHFDMAGLAALTYLLAVMLDGSEVVLAMSGVAIGLTQLALRSHGEPAGYAALVFLSMAAGHVLAIEAPPAALVQGVAWPLAASAALAAVVLAAWACTRVEWSDPSWRRALGGVTAVVALYAASVLVVTPFQPGTEGATSPLLDLGVRQQGQVLLSALWTACGFGALIVGLRRDLKVVRVGALALLMGTVGKVFLYDLAALTSIYRVISFIVLGLVLLAAAFTWQRLRPRELADMREVPEGIR